MYFPRIPEVHIVLYRSKIIPEIVIFSELEGNMWTDGVFLTEDSYTNRGKINRIPLHEISHPVHTTFVLLCYTIIKV